MVLGRDEESGRGCWGGVRSGVRGEESGSDAGERRRRRGGGGGEKSGAGEGGELGGWWLREMRRGEWCWGGVRRVQ